MTGGLGNFFKKVIPIIMLICFISFGISIIFQNTDITYLKHITIDSQGNTLEHNYYTFDFNSYVQNIDIDILKRAITNIIDTESYQDVLNSWETIWTDGYQLGDIFSSIVNGFIMLIDVAITAINFLIVPIRIIAGVLLTGLSILGIDINSNGTIITSLNTLLDSATIPLIDAFYVN